MNWSIVQTILTVVFGIIAIISIVVVVKMARRKKPVWAVNTQKIIGIETDAPAELKLYFSEKSINDALRTIIVFFNKGNEAIREDDISESIIIHFRGAQILREPTINKPSKEPIKFTARQVVQDGDDSIRVGFRYLGHNDGATIEVLHTEAKSIFITGDIMDTEIVESHGYEPHQLRPSIRGAVIGSIVTACAIAGIVLGLIYDLESDVIYLLSGGVIGASAAVIQNLIQRYVQYKRFPSWSRLKKLTIT